MQSSEYEMLVLRIKWCLNILNLFALQADASNCNFRKVTLGNILDSNILTPVMRCSEKLFHLEDKMTDLFSVLKGWTDFVMKFGCSYFTFFRNMRRVDSWTRVNIFLLKRLDPHIKFAIYPKWRTEALCKADNSKLLNFKISWFWNWKGCLIFKIELDCLFTS